MSNGEQPSGENNGEPQTVRDPNEYVNKRRLQGIFDIREELHDVRLKITAAESDRETDNFEALGAYRSLVDSYILEVEPLMMRYDIGKEYLHKHDFGKTVLQPSYREVSNSRHRTNAGQYEVYDFEKDEYVSSTTEPGWESYSFNGLTSLLKTQNPLTGSFEITKPKGSGFRSNSDTSVVAVAQVDRGILDPMVRAVNRFLAKVGFELDPEDEDPEPWDIEDAGL